MKKISREEIVRWLRVKNSRELFVFSDKLCQKYFKSEVCLRGIIEFSNSCEKDCLYCGLRKSNKQLKRYRMSPEQIVETASWAGKMGYKTILLQSGEEESCDIDILSEIIRKIKKDFDCAITLSIGEKSFSEYKKLKDAGADRYLLRFETSDQRLFEKLKPDSSYNQRFTCLDNLKVLGFQVGSGIMVGLPGQTDQTLAEDILLLGNLDLDMIGIGPFLPHHNTPLAAAASGKLELTLRVLSLIRSAMPEVHLPATTAMGSVEKNGRQKALCSGANVIMANITPIQYRKYYQLYSNKICIDQEPKDCFNYIEKMLKSLGKTIAAHRGDSIRKYKKI